jgi:hypothetical protein
VSPNESESVPETTYGPALSVPVVATTPLDDTEREAFAAVVKKLVAPDEPLALRASVNVDDAVVVVVPLSGATCVMGSAVTVKV